jgi:hypothetical protein
MWHRRIVGIRVKCELDFYQGRQRGCLSTRPGITSLWEVSGRSNLDSHDWIRMDLESIDRWSLALDFKLRRARSGEDETAFLRAVPVDGDPQGGKQLGDELGLVDGDLFRMEAEEEVGIC